MAEIRTTALLRNVLPLQRRESGHRVGHRSLAIDAIDWQIGPPAPADGASSGGESETALIRGTLSLGADHNPRHLLGAFRVFVDALQADPRLQVDVLQQPFDVESGKALKSGDSLGGGEQPRPFAVQVRRKAAA